MREALEAILYSESEGALIFPEGDTLLNPSVSYVSDEIDEESLVEKGKEHEVEDGVTEKIDEDSTVGIDFENERSLNQHDADKKESVDSEAMERKKKSVFKRLTFAIACCVFVVGAIVITLLLINNTISEPSENERVNTMAGTILDKDEIGKRPEATEAQGDNAQEKQINTDDDKSDETEVEAISAVDENNEAIIDNYGERTKVFSGNVTELVIEELVKYKKEDDFFFEECIFEMDTFISSCKFLATVGDYASLEFQNCIVKDIDDVDFKEIGDLSNIRSLKIGGDCDIPYNRFIPLCNRLNEFEIVFQENGDSNCFDFDISSLNCSETLSNLKIVNAGLTDISALEEFTKLSFIDLSNNNIASISSLANNIELMSLDIMNNKLESFDGL